MLNANFVTSDPNIIRYKKLVDGDGLTREKSDEKFKFKYPNLNPAILVGEIKDAAGKTKSTVGGKQQSFELQPLDSVSFIINDDEKWYGDNAGKLTIAYSATAKSVQPTKPVEPQPKPELYTITDLYNTGVDNARQVLGDSVADSHYTLATYPAGTVTPGVTTPNKDLAPINWIANTQTARWIGPNTASAYGPVGDYSYKTTFTLPSFSEALIVGQLSVDDRITDILVNGVSVGNPVPLSSWTTIQRFSISTGFVVGTNTIEFKLHSVGGPTGLQVDNISGTYKPAQKGKIVVNSDEWTLSNKGFQNSPDAAKFAINVAKYFVGEAKGKFHALSNNFGLIESSLEQTLTQAGHIWTKGTNITIDLPTLSKYDGIFLAADPVDNQVLIQYVKNGGKVYLAAGTGMKDGKNSWDNSQAEADRWNTFLAEFGLKLEGTYNRIEGNVAPNQAHPLFEGVKALYFGYGNSITDLKPESPLNQIVQTHSSGQGLIATAEFDPAANLLWAGVWAGGAIISVDGNKLTIDMSYHKRIPATGTIDANDPTRATVTFHDASATFNAQLSNGKITWFLASNSALWGFWDRSKYWFA